MSISIRPRGLLEDEVINRILGNIPEGDFYLRSQYNLPILNGTGYTPFIIKGNRGAIVSLYLNNKLYFRIGLVSPQETVNIQLKISPTINHIKVIDEADNSTSSISVVISNIATIFTGAGKEYFRQIWLPYLFYNWGLIGEWSTRVVEYSFKYLNRFPDTQAMRTLCSWLNSRAVWNDSPTTLGVNSQIGALSGGIPSITQISNIRSYHDVGIWPLFSPQTDFGGFDVNVWSPDISEAQESSFLQFVKNFSDAYLIKDAHEGGAQLGWMDDEYLIQLRKQKRGGDNLSHVFSLIGAMDYWQVFSTFGIGLDVYFRYYSHSRDSKVIYPMSGGRTFDEGRLLDLDVLDSTDPFSEKWNGLSVFPLDTGIESLDSVIKVGLNEDEVNQKEPYGAEWEYMSLSASTSTSSIFTNILHGGCDSSFVWDGINGPSYFVPLPPGEPPPEEPPPEEPPPEEPPIH